MWGLRKQVEKLASEAHSSHTLMQAEYFAPKRKEPKPSPLLYCSQCGVYATHRVLGLKNRCVPPKKGAQPRGRNKTQHHAQYWKCEPVPIDSDSDLEVEPTKRAHEGKTQNSLGRLNRRIHPAHSAPLLKVEPFVWAVKHKSVKPRSSKTRVAGEMSQRGGETSAVNHTSRFAGEPSQRGGETSAANHSSGSQSCSAINQASRGLSSGSPSSVTWQDIDTSERLAAEAVGFEDDPEEEDHFGLCGL